MKNTDLFGGEIIELGRSKSLKKRTLFDDYDGFVDKFQQKKTTDDCYTPLDVYECVLGYVREFCGMTGGESILRPFYPGGDYEAFDYPENSVVVDNPPFSIISKIVRFYTKNRIRFFLFAPHLTLFSSKVDATGVVCAVDITYENGARVKTSFLTNMLGEVRVMAGVELYNRLSALNDEKKANLPVYRYPGHVLTVSMVQNFVNHGIHFSLDAKSVRHYSSLDHQKAYGKSIFGSGFLISEKAAAEKAAAEKAAAEKNNVITWELSAKEIEIIKTLK